MKKVIDLTGLKFGSLLVIKRDGEVYYGKIKQKSIMWLCLCDCGKYARVASNKLKHRPTITCGCANIGKEWHGLSGTRTYVVWTSIKGRILNKNNSSYKNYGGRGLTMSKRWAKSYLSFLGDMGEAPINKSIHRINNNLGYFKSNCEWTNRKVQSRNTRKSRLISFNGETKNLVDWAKKFKLRVSAVHRRLDIGWSIKDALTTASGCCPDCGKKYKSSRKAS